MTDNKYCTEEANKEGHEPTKCGKCGFICCSSILEGGGQIADTGDYNDPSCPLCGSCEIEDYDGPYVDQSEMLYDWAKKSNERWEGIYWEQQGKMLDIESRMRFYEISKHVRPEPAKKDDNKSYITFPSYSVFRWYDNNFWRWSEVHSDMVIATDVTHFAHLPEPPK